MTEVRCEKLSMALVFTRFILNLQFTLYFNLTLSKLLLTMFQVWRFYRNAF